MANRSDFNSVLPRQIKRMIDLVPYMDAHERGEIIRLWCAAHAHHKVVRNKSLAARSVARDGDGE